MDVAGKLRCMTMAHDEQRCHGRVNPLDIAFSIGYHGNVEF
jgi:hypothetical protein